MIKIPKIILQTSRKTNQYLYVKNMLYSKSNGWDYVHFNDSQIINFFEKNPLDEFPNIINKFNSIKNGAHKADLFRYYFIYIHGGVFIDDDAMIQTNLDSICRDFDFFSVNAEGYSPGCIFNGLIGATKNNDIIYAALKDTYNIDINNLNKEYLLICKNLYNIIYNKKWNMNIKIYYEVWGSSKVALGVDRENNNKLIYSHYFVDKVIPNNFFNPNHLLETLKIKIKK